MTSKIDQDDSDWYLHNWYDSEDDSLESDSQSLPDSPTLSPTNAPTLGATDVPTPRATDVPKLGATDVPTPRATDVPALGATNAPTVETTDVPTLGATDVPTPRATDVPALGATNAPTVETTDVPTLGATDVPNLGQTDFPTQDPTGAPTQNLQNVTHGPSIPETQSPTDVPRQICTGNTRKDQPALPKHLASGGGSHDVSYSRMPQWTSPQTTQVLPACTSAQLATQPKVGSPVQGVDTSHGPVGFNSELSASAQDTLLNSKGRGSVSNVYNFPPVQNEVDWQLRNIIGQSELCVRDLKGIPFVKTHFIKQSEKFLHTRGMVVLTGRSGDGKTSAGLHLLKSISEQESRTPVILTDPSQWDHIPVKLKERKVQQTFVVLIDDAFGKSNLSQDLMDRWDKKFPMMIPVIENGNVKLVITSRSNILSACVGKITFLKKCANVDFSVIEEHHAQERLDILEGHLKLFGNDTCIDKFEKQRIVQSTDLMGFPQCCSVFAKDKSLHIKASTFFSKPLKCLSENIRSLSECDPVGYMVLLLVFLKGGELHKSFFYPFDQAKKDRDLLEKLLSFRNCDLDQLESKAKTMCPMYLAFVENKESYMFVHQSVMDVISIQVCKEKLSTGLKFCTLSVLLEYVRTSSTSESDHIILIPRNKFGILSERLTQELLSTNQELIITHPAFQDPEFCHFLINSFWKDEDKEELVNSQKCTKEVFTKVFFSEQTVERLSALALGTTEDIPVLHIEDVLVLRFTSVLCYFALRGCNLLVMDLMATAENCLSDVELTQIRQDVLATSMFKGNSVLIQEMLMRKTCISEACIIAACASETADNTAFDHILNTFDTTIMNIFRWRLMALLLEKNKRETLGKLALLMCNTDSDKGRELIVQLSKCFLLQFHNVTPLLYLRAFGCMKKDALLELLPIFCSLGINCSTDELVLLAAGGIETYPLSMIHGYGGNLACTTSRGDTPLHLAAHLGTAEMVEYLLQLNADKSLKNSEGWLPLHFAAQSDIESEKKCHLLLEPGHVSTATVSGMTPLMLACKAGNIICVQYFFRENCNSHLGDHPIHATILGLCETYTESNLQNHHDHPELIQKWLDIIDILQNIGYSFSHRYENLSPIELTIRLDRWDILRLLLDRWPFLLDELEKNTVSNLNVQRIYPKYEYTRCLREKGASVNAKHMNDMTLLHLAVQHAKHETVEYLIEKGASVNVKDFVGVTPLHVAVQYAKHETVEYLIQKGASVNVKDFIGVTPLHVAVKHDKHETVEYLIQKGASVNVKDKTAVTPIHVAVKHAKHETVEYLIEKGARVNVKDKTAVTPLHVAVQYAKHETVEYLIQKGASVNVKDFIGVTPLHVAVKHDKHETVEYLIEKGASVTAKDDFGVTPLHVARQYAKHETVEYLIEKGASVNAEDNNGVTPLHVAVQHAKHETVEYLIQKGASVTAKDDFGVTPLHVARQYAKHETVEYLIEKGASVTAKDDFGVTPLHVALQYAKHETVEYLIEKGASVTAKDDFGVTPLHVALQYAKHETVEYLIEKGASVIAKDDFGVTPLHVALQHAKHEAVEYLIQKGASVNVKDKSGVTPLHVAVKHDKHETVEYLIQKGASVNVKDKSGVTPLHVAVQYAKHETVEYLIQKGASVNVKDKSGVTPLHVAVKHDKHETVEYLIQKGASVNAEDNFGVTPLDVAGQYTKHETVRYLIQNRASLNGRWSY